jgi:hypothetical protein
MGESKIYIIPRDEHFVPAPSAAKAALDYLRQTCPGNRDIAVNQTNGIKFYDAGEFFATITCPHCHEELDVEWWAARMTEDEGPDGHRVASYPLPCCGATATLNQLVYDAPQGFARFAIDIYNDAGVTLTDPQVKAIEALLGCAVRVVDYWM